jgi:UDP:flavonoid glycosyltransferase YjiC (YdhE family)
MQEKSRFHSYRILCVITGCGGGDWPPLLALAEGLHQRGHHLRVICDKSTVKSVQAAGLTTICLPQALDLAIVFEPAISSILSRKEKILKGSVNPLKTWGESCVDYIKEGLQGWFPSLVLTSLLGIGLGEILSKEFSTPRCFLNPSFYFGHSQDHYWDTDFSEVGAQMYQHWLLPLAKTANLVLHATDREFDNYPTVLSHHHKYVGPMFWEMPGNSQYLFEKSGPPWVLITLSTSPQSGELAIVRTALKPLGTMNVRVLVTLAPGHDKDDLGPIPPNVHVTGYTPHSKVLPYCRLVISHAGHGIVMKAMVHGIPMVLVPWGRDQPGVAARAKRLGIAAIVPRSECKVDALTSGIEKILNNPIYLKRSQVLACRLQKFNGVAKAVSHIERFFKNR